MSEHTTDIPALKFWSEEVSRYDDSTGSSTDNWAYQLRGAAIKFDTASPYVGKLVAMILPVLIEERQPATVEFVTYMNRRGDFDQLGSIHGVIIRDAEGYVLLYVYGLSLNTDPQGSEVREAIFNCFGITAHEQKQLMDAAWPTIDYSILFEVR